MESHVYRIIYENIFHFYNYEFITVQAIKKYQIKNEKGYNQFFFSIALKNYEM